MSSNYDQDIELAKDILSGDASVWRLVIHKVSKAIGSWKNSDTIDWQSIVNSGVWKAAQTYQPKRKFLNHAVHVTKNMLCQAFRYQKVRNDIGSCSLEQVPDKIDYNSDLLDVLIAKEEALVLLAQGTREYVMTRLILAGKSRSEAAKIMGIDRHQAHAIVVRMREVLEE